MDRLGLWSYTLSNFIAPHPIFGVGPLNFAAFSNPYGVAHPHNVILKIAAEWGIPAALIFCFITGKALLTWFKFFKKNQSTLDSYFPRLFIQSTLTLIILGGVVDSMLSGNTVMPLSQLFLTIIWGWAYGLVTENSSPSHAAKNPQTHIYLPFNLKNLKTLGDPQKIERDLLFTLGLSIGIVMIISMTTHDLIHSQQSHEAIQEACKNKHHCTLPPLFWFPEQVSPINAWLD
jgi:hypothetical protein